MREVRVYSNLVTKANLASAIQFRNSQQIGNVQQTKVTDSAEEGGSTGVKGKYEELLY